MAAGAQVGRDQVTLDQVQIGNIAASTVDCEPVVLGPPECVEPAAIYKLYRGAVGEVHGQHYRVWVEFPALQLCWAAHDLPARGYDRASLLDLALCRCSRVVSRDESEVFRIDIYSHVEPVSSGSDVCGGGAEAPAPAAEPFAGSELRPVLAVMGSSEMREFAAALQQLLESREKEGRRGLVFIQKRLFQYLWRHQGNSFTEQALYEAQAVLAFNLDPKEGVAYLRGKLGKGTDAEVGEWLAQMSTLKGGLDPTMLGAYFSRRDTIEVFKAFVHCLDFRGLDIEKATRRLFDTFKPGGEGQVITRILELFAEAYYVQWVKCKEHTVPATAYNNADSVLQVSVSLIMLNTGLHVAPKKVGKKGATVAAMTPEEYIENTRRVVVPGEVPDDALICWYNAVKEAEISVEPLPRVAFSKLPVQPDIEGWLIAIFSSQMQQRFWAVLALQRMYLFSDTSEVEPAHAIDLKDAVVRSVKDDKACRERFVSDLNRGCRCFPLVRNGKAKLLDADNRAFEVARQTACAPSILKHLSASKPRPRLALVAESSDLAEKWVHLIKNGPY